MRRFPLSRRKQEMRKTLLLVILGVISMAVGSERAWGALLNTRCVDASGSGDYEDLQDALDFALGSTGPDLIKVARGTYTGHFRFYSSGGYSITLWGGYEPGTGCATRVMDPSGTILDGSGTEKVLVLSNENRGSVTVDGFTIQNGNGGSGVGGGLLAGSSSSSGVGDNVTVTNNLFIGNSAAQHGGGVFAESDGQTGSGSVTISNNTFTGNSAGEYGGGIYASSETDSGPSGTVTLEGNTCTENHAERDGGGIYGRSYSKSGAAGDVTVQENTCTKNTTDQSGGGIYAESDGATGSGKVSVRKNTCTGNAARWGGGVYAYNRATSGTAGTVLIWGNTASGNTASSYYGGIFAESFSVSGTGGPVTLVNNIVSGNIASSNYGGVSAESYGNPGGPTSAVTLTNNTITQNSGSTIGGVFLASHENSVYVYNNIIWGNAGDDIFLHTGPVYGYNNNYSTIAGSWDSEADNLNVDPKFLATGHWDDAGTPAEPSDDTWVNGDYHLSKSSPCIDKGLNTARQIPSKDFEGDDRILKGKVDMGADETKFGPAMLDVLLLLLE
jgi:predicted outer membrane repeat protein